MTPHTRTTSNGKRGPEAPGNREPGASGGESEASGNRDPEKPPPRYKRYRTGRLARKASRAPPLLRRPPFGGGNGTEARSPGRATLAWRRGRHAVASSTARFRGHITLKGVVLGVIGLLVCWVLLSSALLLLSAHFERISPPADVKNVLDPGGFMLTSANNVLVLGSDRRPKGSREPGANTSGPSNSDVMMVIRTGGGNAARLSIPRDTVVEIPGHGLQKINAAYAFGGPALAISVVEHYLGIPINHVVEVNFENFPRLIDAMGGVGYTGGCVLSYMDGGDARGGFTLRLNAGTHHLDGKEALALARTRENHCGPQAPLPDLSRIQRQQALFAGMKSQLLSFTSFVRLPWIAWNVPPAIISDMSGPELLTLFAALAIGGSPPTHVLEPTGTVTLGDGEVGLEVSEADRRAAVARFLRE